MRKTIWAFVVGVVMICTIAIARFVEEMVAQARGIVAYSGHEFDLAISYYDKAIQIDPNNADAFFRRACAYEGKGDYDKAIADATESIRLTPKNAWTTIWFYRFRGKIHDRKREWDEAIVDYTNAIQIGSNEGVLYSDRGEAYENKGDRDKAEADFAEARRLGCPVPNNKDAATDSTPTN